MALLPYSLPICLILQHRGVQGCLKARYIGVVDVLGAEDDYAENNLAQGEF